MAPLLATEFLDLLLPYLVSMPSRKNIWSCANNTGRLSAVSLFHHYLATHPPRLGLVIISPYLYIIHPPLRHRSSLLR